MFVSAFVTLEWVIAECTQQVVILFKTTTRFVCMFVLITNSCNTNYLFIIHHHHLCLTSVAHAYTWRTISAYNTLPPNSIHSQCSMHEALLHTHPKSSYPASITNSFNFVTSTCRNSVIIIKATRTIYEQFATIALWSRDIDVYYCWMLSLLFAFFLLLCPILLWQINVSIILFLHMT